MSLSLTTYIIVLDEMVRAQRGRLEKPSDAFILGERSRLAPTLRALYTPGEEYPETYRIMAGLVTAISGVSKTRKHVASHIICLRQFIARDFTVKHSAMSVILCMIAGLAELPPYDMHDALYDLLNKGTLEVDDSGLSIGDDVRDLEVIVKSISPAFRYGIRSILLTYKDDKFGSFARILDGRNFPGPESLYLRCCKIDLDGNSYDGFEEESGSLLYSYSDYGCRLGGKRAGYLRSS